MKDITQIDEGTNLTPGGKEVAGITYIRRRKGDDGHDMWLERDGKYRKGGSERPMDDDFKIDSTDRGLHAQGMIKRSGDMAFNMCRRDNDGPENEKGPRWGINSNRESSGGQTVAILKASAIPILIKTGSAPISAFM